MVAAAWRCVLKIGRLHTSDAYLDAGPTPKWAVTIMDPDDLADERWRRDDDHGGRHVSKPMFL